MQPQLILNDRGRYEIRYFDGSRTRYKSTRTGDPAKAARVLGAFIAGGDLGRAGGASGERPALAALLQAYQDRYVDRFCAAGSVANMRSVLRRLRAGVGSATVDSARQVLDRWVDRRRREGVADGTIRKELLIAQSALNWAAREGLIARRDVPALELPAGSPPRTRWLRESEIEALLDACRVARQGPRRFEPFPRVEVFVRLALMCGARRAAIEGLRWEQVDLARGVIDFAEPGVHRRRKKRPRVPMSGDVRAMLDEQAVEREWAVSRGKSDGVWVLYHPGTVYPAFKTAVKRAGLGADVTPHVLRHTYAAHALRRGVSIWDVSRVMGDTVKTVEENYGHHAADYLLDAVG